MIRVSSQDAGVWGENTAGRKGSAESAERKTKQEKTTNKEGSQRVRSIKGLVRPNPRINIGFWSESVPIEVSTGASLGVVKSLKSLKSLKTLKALLRGRVKAVWFGSAPKMPVCGVKAV